MIARLIKSKTRVTCILRTEMRRILLSGDPYDILADTLGNRENGQLVYHLGTGGGLGQVEWREEKPLTDLEKHVKDVGG